MAEKEIDCRFSKFGTVSFTGLTRVNDFIDHLQQGRVMGTRCKTCGTRYFPPRADCCKSLDSDMEWFDVKGTGTLLTYSTLSYAPTGFGQDLPYTIAVVDFGSVRVFGRLHRSIPAEDIAIGMPLKPAVRNMPDGNLMYEFLVAS
ncbi:MAG: Zn-ribbon domain-containing OB-fold protein [Deltaproteobacteria bacterium]|nr:Zn-ribbon domain-containing OB-fold protein [Deltaproteobacteria bacterium]